jgi:hypothetical protein
MAEPAKEIPTDPAVAAAGAGEPAAPSKKGAKKAEAKAKKEAEQARKVQLHAPNTMYPELNIS